MSVASEIKKVCRQIVDNFQPQKIILFGSNANGKRGEDSDIDLLVVMPFDGRNVEQAVKIRQCVSSKIPLDLIVRTSNQIQERIALEDFFIKEIIERGKVLYEADNAGMG